MFTFLVRFSKGIKTHIYTFLYKKQLGYVGARTRIRPHCLLRGDSLSKVKVGNGCYIDTYNVIECSSQLVKDGKKVIPELTIGNGCNFGEYNHITAVNKIVIGNNLLTGRFVLITDNSHGSFRKDELSIHPSSRPITSKGEIIIGDNVWLGDKVSILPGVHIGDGCVIGANSVVTHSIPPYSIAAGNPARVLKTVKE